MAVVLRRERERVKWLLAELGELNCWLPIRPTARILLVEAAQSAGSERASRIELLLMLMLMLLGLRVRGRWLHLEATD